MAKPLHRDPLRVAVVGADVNRRGFGARCHLPAVLATPGLELTAVCTAHAASAEAAARTWGAPRWYADHCDLMADPNIDLVTIAVRVSAHHTIARAALEAGKTVYCEWPLAANLAEARDLAELAQTTGIAAAVGMQGRHAPAVQYARALFDAGEIGRPLFFQLTHFLPRFKVRSDHPWSAWRESGSGALGVALAHSVEPLQFLLGRVASVCGISGTLAPDDVYVDTGAAFRWTAEDTVSVLARLDGEMHGVIQVSNIATQAEGFHLNVFGERGQLTLRAPAYVSYTPSRLLITRPGENTAAALVIPERFVSVRTLPEESAGYNMAQALVQLARAHRGETHYRPDFADGLRMHLLIDAIRRSNESGQWTVVES